MGLEFYYDLRSQPCRAIYYLLKSTNVEYEARVMDLFNGDQNKPEFLKINPFHSIPVINDNGFILTESVAIMRYIAMKNNVAEHWYPRQDVQKLARVDEFLNWHHTGLRKPCIMLFVTKFRTRLDFGPLSKIPYDEEKIKELRGDVLKAANGFADYFLKDKPFISGEEISVADLSAYCELMHLDIAEEGDVFSSNKAVVSWMKRVEEKVRKFNDEVLEAMNGVKNLFANAKK